MIAAVIHLPFKHVPWVAHSLQRSVTVSQFDNVLAKYRKVVGHFKHSPVSAAELEQKQIELGQKKKSFQPDGIRLWT